MKILLFLAFARLALADPGNPIVSADLVFAEKDGLVAIEAEHFFQQTSTEKRAWYLTTQESAPEIAPDGDPSHIAGAAGGAYLEILPDTRRTHDDKLIVGENVSNEPSKMAVLSYKVHFDTPGKYWLWARAFSTTSEDNGLHFGIDGAWPETAQRWQTVVKNRWHWKSAQRTKEVHIGVPGILTLDVPTAGEHLIHLSMREDGIALDKILLVNRQDYTPQGLGPVSAMKSGKVLKSFPFVKGEAAANKPNNSKNLRPAKTLALSASSFDLSGTGFYLDREKWAAINPQQREEARVSTAFPFPEGNYNLTLQAVGEEDGSSTYTVLVNGSVVGAHTCPLSEESIEEGAKFHATFPEVEIALGDVIEVVAKVASSDGQEYARARWAGLSFQPADQATRKAVASYSAPESTTPAPAKPVGPPLQLPRQANGDGSIAVSGELKQWHKVTLTLDGPYAHELDNAPNPFTDYSLDVTFTHPEGGSFQVPGYFAADGNAGDTSAEAGTQWKVHFAPNTPGEWSYQVSFLTAPLIITGNIDSVSKVMNFHEQKGTFTILPTDKRGRDFRSKGRLSYVGKHHLQFEGDKSYFVKAGADAPETLLGFADFDGTEALNPKKVPLKTYSTHVRDWKAGDPTWQNGKGKGLVGALNYLSEAGANAFSFLPYNVDGDGSNVWPFVAPRDKYHYDCSKLDQWGQVFDHATAKGLYLHFKMQENEIDDNRRGHQAKGGEVRAALDGGKLGVERRLYCRELVARFGHALALNWNIGEECTQSTEEIKEMVSYIRAVDPYDHNIVLHTFPDQQDKQYRPLLGYGAMTGLSLQNSNVKDCHHQVVKWTKLSSEAKHPWVVAFDEPGDAGLGMPPDPNWPGMPKDYKGPSIHDVRKYTLWGTLMAGGGGVEYYFGYKLPENDLVAQDWRSRDQSWGYCRVAVDFFAEEKIPLCEMTSRNDLIGNEKNDNSAYCFAKEGELYLVYLPQGGKREIALPKGSYRLHWFNPRTGESNAAEDLTSKELSAPDKEDWLAVVRKAGK